MPIFEILKTWRISTSPSVFSLRSGASMPVSAAFTRSFLLGTDLAQVSLRSPYREEGAHVEVRLVDGRVEWSVNGARALLEPEDWKDILTASLRKHHRIAEGIDGGFVFLGMRTSKMTKDQMIELIELMYAFGAEREVKWSEPE